MPKKRIALLAHERRTNELVEWVERNFETLARRSLVSTRSTGMRVEEALYRGLSRCADRVVQTEPVLLLRPRALGGHRELAGLVAAGAIEFVIWLGGAVNPSALVRIACVRDVPIAWNIAEADILISFPAAAREPLALAL